MAVGAGQRELFIARHIQAASLGFRLRRRILNLPPLKDQAAGNKARQIMGKVWQPAGNSFDCSRHNVMAVLQQ